MSKRFIENDYATVSNNPYKTFGTELGGIYQSILQRSRHEIFHGNLFVPTNPEDKNRLKAMTKRELDKNGILYSEGAIDRFSEQIKDYKLTSEGIINFLDNAAHENTITIGEHDIIYLELQEMAATTSTERLRSIIYTTEYEVSNSMLTSATKDKLLLFNALAKNSIVDNPGPVASRSVPNLAKSPFQKTTPVVVATVLVVWAAVTLIQAWQDPSCDANCQLNMAANAATYVALGQLICEAYGDGSTCPCDTDEGCWLDNGRCICL